MYFNNIRSVLLHNIFVLDQCSGDIGLQPKNDANIHHTSRQNTSQAETTSCVTRTDIIAIILMIISFVVGLMYLIKFCERDAKY